MHASRALERIDRMMVGLGERSGRRLWPAFPYSIRLDHQPTADLRPRYGFGRPPHPRLEALFASKLGRFRTELEGFQPFFDELALFALDDERSPEPCWIHPWLIGLDTVSLYSYVRQRRPALYVEVGSGQSTKVVAKATRDGQTGTVIRSIDPRPRSEVDELCDTVVRQTLEEADLPRAFGDLQRGDIVFLDGSHRVLPNSDCVTFFLDVLPNLPAGVLVGIHDVFLPSDYPQPFMEMWWSEQYVLAALLLSGAPGLSIVLPTFYVSTQPELAPVTAPLFNRPSLAKVDRRGSLFWLETNEEEAL